ncbi:MAG: response regulator [bacterium]
MRRILVVDDEEKIRRIYRSLLKPEGFEVLEASNAVDANKILKENPIDLVLLDIKMSGVAGSKLYTAIRLFHKEVKVIVASVYPIDEQRNIIKDATDYYDKAEGTDKLLSKIKNALRDTTTN